MARVSTAAAGLLLLCVAGCTSAVQARSLRRSAAASLIKTPTPFRSRTFAPISRRTSTFTVADAEARRAAAPPSPPPNPLLTDPNRPTSWPELVGKDKAEAQDKIKALGYEVYLVDEGNDFVQLSHMPNRVYIYCNPTTGVVTRMPKVG